MLDALHLRPKTSVRQAVVLAATLVAVLGTAAPASAAQRYASPTSIDTVGSCRLVAPCRIDHAVGGAAAGDDVVVLPGAYAVGTSIEATVPVDVHGVVGQPRPRLIGSSSLVDHVLALSAGGSLRHLYVEARTPLSYAVELAGGVASGLEANGANGAGGIQLLGASGGTLLHDSVARSAGDAAIQAKDGTSAGPVKILNVTAVADAGGTGVKSKHTTASTVLRNSIARGGDYDVRTANGGAITVERSNYRPAASLGHNDGAGNQSAEPMFADAASGDLRPAAGSPTIDAGMADEQLGATDADGRARTIGASPDLGAFEYDPSGAPVLAPATPPLMGTTVAVGPASGTVRVRPPGSDVAVELEQGATIPVGSRVDAREGVVRLTSAANAAGTKQTGTFWGAVFKVEQVAATRGYTDLVLAGGKFSRCKRRVAASGSGVFSALRWPRYVRRLWGRDRGGRVRTRGRRGHAVVRGTRWLTEDRCDGTLFVVKEGAIDVRPNRGGRRVRLDAGERLLIPTRR